MTLVTFCEPNFLGLMPSRPAACHRAGRPRGQATGACLALMPPLPVPGSQSEAMLNSAQWRKGGGSHAWQTEQNPGLWVSIKQLVQDPPATRAYSILRDFTFRSKALVTLNLPPLSCAQMAGGGEGLLVQILSRPHPQPPWSPASPRNEATLGGKK